MISKDIRYQIHNFSDDIFCVLTQNNVFLVNHNYLDDFLTMFGSFTVKLADLVIPGK